jgi:hypothetical protein
MTHLYIDTNAYLTFYHLTNDDLEELKKVQVLIEKTGEITLHLPEQTRDEFSRNREVKIADALLRFKEEKLNNQFPRICKEYPEFKKMQAAIKEYDQNKSKLSDKLNKDISDFNLEADKVIEALFKISKFYPSTDDLILKAKTRYDLGKPPGKKKSYGDALNWETLLLNLTNGDDLYFVSEDKDYYSELNSDLFNNYLLKEWLNKKKSTIFSFKRMSEFFKSKFPDIKIASEYEKEILIKNLSGSGSYARSRLLLQKLSEFDEFSSEQLDEIIIACTNNSQIYWIRTDDDIKEIISGIVKPNRDKANEKLLESFDEMYEYCK